MKRPNLTVAALTAVLALSACSSIVAQTDAETGTGSASTTPSAPVSTPGPSSTTGLEERSTAITITAAGRTFDATINDSQPDQSRDFGVTWSPDNGMYYGTVRQRARSGLGSYPPEGSEPP